MPYATQEVTDWAGDALLSGKFDPFLWRYADTVAVFTPTSIYCLAGEDDMRATLGEHRDAVLSRGVIGLTGEVVAVSLPRGPKFRTYIDWTYHMGGARPSRVASATYYWVHSAGGPRIEMIEYRRLAFPDARVWHENRELYRRDPKAPEQKVG